jgi:hypothetical protein
MDPPHTTPLHTNTEILNGHKKIIITHPFHPDQGNEYGYLGEAGDRVRCLDAQGKIREFPINITNLHEGLCPRGGKCVMSIEDLLLLKKAVDTLLRDNGV